MDQETAPNRQATCVKCGEPAKFLTPYGALCPDHALIASIAQVSEDPWYPLPIHLNWKISKNVRTAIGSDRYLPGSG